MQKLLQHLDRDQIDTALTNLHNAMISFNGEDMAEVTDGYVDFINEFIVSYRYDNPSYIKDIETNDPDLMINVLFLVLVPFDAFDEDMEIQEYLDDGIVVTIEGEDAFEQTAPYNVLNHRYKLALIPFWFNADEYDIVKESFPILDGGSIAEVEQEIT